MPAEDFTLASTGTDKESSQVTGEKLRIKRKKYGSLQEGCKKQGSSQSRECVC